VVAPRPPGNVQARQALALFGPPRVGERIRTVVTCVDKRIKRDRRQVDIRTEGTGEGGRPVYTGRMTLIWAA
jgi:acyl dehydratase